MSETVTDVPTRMANEIASAYEEAVNNMASADISVTEVPSCDTASKIPNGTAPQGEGAPAPGSTAPGEEGTAPASAPAPGSTALGGEGTAPASGGDTLRLRMKVWTDPQTHRRYLMPSAFMRDIVRGQPVSDVMYAYAMRDDDTKVVTLTALEWNSLPFFYFREDGWAPRAGERPIDVIR